MCMRIDATGDDVLAGSVVNRFPVARNKVGTNLGDATVVADPHVGPTFTIDVDNGSSDDQHRPRPLMPTSLASMEIEAEFTVEPFVEGDLGDHVQAAFDAVRAEGLEVEVGPFGSSVAGPAEQVSRAIGRLVADATEAGATRISFQVSRREA